MQHPLFYDTQIRSRVSGWRVLFGAGSAEARYWGCSETAAMALAGAAGGLEGLEKKC